MRILKTTLLAAALAASTHASAKEFFYRGKAATFTAEQHYGAPSPRVLSAPDGAVYVGETATLSFSASRGVAPIAWSVAGQPPGMSISSDGTLSGNPTAPGTFAASVKATDSRGISGSVERRIVVAALPAATIPSTAASTASVGKAFTLSMSASGGDGTISWTFSDLPAWASGNASGTVSGTPTTATATTVAATARDAQGRTSTVTFTLASKAVSDTAMIAMGWGGVATTKDGVTWTNATMPSGGLYYGAAHGNGRWVAVSDNAVTAWSDDGKAWTAGTGGSGVGDMKGIAYGNGYFVAVGSNGTASRSIDGKSWEAARTIPGAGRGNGIAFGDGRFVTANAGGIFSSTDGQSWTKRSTFSGGSVDFANGRWIVGDADASSVNFRDQGNVNVSTDLTNWTRTNTAINNYGGTAYGNGAYVTVGTYGNAGRSGNTSTWTKFSLVPGSVGYHDVIFTSGSFYVAGDSRAVYRSADGANWSTVATNLNFTVFQLVSAD